VISDAEKLPIFLSLKPCRVLQAKKSEVRFAIRDS
jgi:hypothetical protein